MANSGIAAKTTFITLLSYAKAPKKITKSRNWIAIDQHTKHILGFVCGKRDSKTFKRLYNHLSTDNITLLCTDYWKAYADVIPTYKHLQSKKQTFTIESYNDRIHHYLARFKRRTKCYSKCKKIIETL